MLGSSDDDDGPATPPKRPRIEDELDLDDDLCADAKELELMARMAKRRPRAETAARPVQPPQAAAPPRRPAAPRRPAPNERAEALARASSAPVASAPGVSKGLPRPPPLRRHRRRRAADVGRRPVPQTAVQARPEGPHAPVLQQHQAVLPARRHFQHMHRLSSA